jgi:tRNA dimethylallyltransferase
VTSAGGLRHVVIVGPTASGKSALGLALAQRLGDAEILSVDSMQVYRRMDIGTAKPTSEDRKTVPHHLLDLVEPYEEFSVAEFQTAAGEALADIEGRGGRAIYLGGTGLYHRAVVDGLQIPGQFPEIVADLERNTTSELFDRLAVLDPLAASRTEPSNRRRILRALEVTIGSGRPFSASGPGLTDYPPSEHVMIGLSVDRALLAGRIRARLAAMMDNGFLEEVTGLVAADPPLSKTAAQALGYRELGEFLRGSCSLDEAVEMTASRTRQFAVRQDRWFRRDPRIQWISADAPDLVDQVAAAVDASGRIT